MKKLKLNVFLIKNKNNSIDVQIHYNLQNHPIYLSAERLVNLIRREELFFALSSY